jgi:hypothetical protein
VSDLLFCINAVTGPEGCRMAFDSNRLSTHYGDFLSGHNAAEARS